MAPEEKNLQGDGIVRIRNIVITIAICLLLVVSIITFISKIVEYNELQNKKSELEAQVHQYKDSIEELEYWLEAPMDDDYIMKFAREKLDLFRADEVVFTGDGK